MINKLSESITKNWMEKDVIESEDYELYHYGLFIVLSEVLFLLFTLLVGAIFNITLPSIVFFVTFSIIRRFAGGFHAKTELHCQIISLSFLFFSVVTIKYSSKHINDFNVICGVLICMILLILFSPSDTPQKPLSISERKMFKKITFFVSIIFFVIIFALLKYNIKEYAIAIVCAFLLETVLVILGRMFNNRLVEK